jgi:hypothetical protein
VLNINEQITCPVLNEVGNFHFEMRCEDCDVNRLSRKTLGAVEDLFQQGRVTRNQLDAYQWAWALLSPTGSNPHWAHQPYVTDPDVRRIARKLLTIRGLAVPDELSDEQPAELVRAMSNAPAEQEAVRAA